MNSSRRKNKRAKGDNSTWLGADRERAIGHLKTAMQHETDPKKKVLLARESRLLRHGTKVLHGPAANRFDFNLGLRDLRSLIPTGVH